MFPKKNRYSFKKGLPKNVYTTPFFVLRYQKTESGGAKIAVIVGKKIDKRSTVRNSIKRQWRHVIKEIIDIKHTSYSIVLYIRKAALGLKTQEIIDSLKKALENTKIEE